MLMMLRLILLLLLPASVLAAPVNPCTGQEITGPVWYYSDITPASTIACLPVPTATSTRPYVVTTAAGAAAYYYCKVDGKWRRQMGAATWAFLTGHNIAADAQAALVSTDPLGTFTGRVRASVSLPLSDPALTQVWCPAADEMWANKPADDVPPPPPPPPPPVYTHAVKPNGLILTRPAYALTNGVRGTREVSRATVGQPCDTTRPTLASGADLWSEFGPAFTAGVVALCAKTTP